MFLLNEILVFAPDRGQEALDRLAWIHGLMARQPGFRCAIVARNVGDSLRHTILRYWDSAGAYQTFRDGPDGSYGRGRPDGLYTNDTVIPRWDGIREWQGPAPGPILVKIERDVPANVWDAFAAYQVQEQTLLSEDGRASAVQALRAAGGDESLVILRFPERVAFERVLTIPAFTSIAASVPSGVVGRSVVSYEVVSERRPD